MSSRLRAEIFLFDNICLKKTYRPEILSTDKSKMKFFVVKNVFHEFWLQKWLWKWM